MLIEAGFKPIYSTGGNDPVNFFLPALFESHQFDLGLGFFSSSGFRALATGFAYFVANGGSTRILINDILSEEDKSAIIKGQKLSAEEVDEIALLTFNNLYKNLSAFGKHFFQCISNLIALKKVEFKATIPTKNPGGIAHHKFGIFRDSENNRLAFTGSINFSMSALYYNIENISCFRSWINEAAELERLEFYENLFNIIWRNESDNLKVISLENIKSRILQKFPPTSNEDLIQNQQTLIKKCKTDISDLPTKYFQQVQSLRQSPRFPFSSGPRDYQQLAYKSWRNNDCKGIFAMATGTGKTITALNCALKEYDNIDVNTI